MHADALPRFHLAFTVDDLDRAREFYGKFLGCREGRATKVSINFEFFGHQIVAYLCAPEQTATNPVDGEDVPMRHFGVILTMEQWQRQADLLKANGARFLIEPYVRFKGRNGEQATLFIADGCGNAIEFKAFADMDRIFMKEADEIGA